MHRLLHWCTCWFNTRTEAGREQVHLKEVECVDHPLKEHKVLCKKVREVQELEIEWIL